MLSSISFCVYWAHGLWACRTPQSGLCWSNKSLVDSHTSLVYFSHIYFWDAGSYMAVCDYDVCFCDCDWSRTNGHCLVPPPSLVVRVGKEAGKVYSSFPFCQFSQCKLVFCYLSETTDLIVSYCFELRYKHTWWWVPSYQKDLRSVGKRNRAVFFSSASGLLWRKPQCFFPPPLCLGLPYRRPLY